MSVEKVKGIAFVDLDGTIYPNLLMADIVIDQMKKRSEGRRLVNLAAIPAILLEIKKYRNGEKGFASNVESLNWFWSMGCQGIRYGDLFTHAKKFVRRNRDKFAPFTQPVFNLLKEREYDVWIVTGEPQFVGQAVSDEFGGKGFCATKWKTDWREDVIVVDQGYERPMTSNRKRAWAESFFTHPNTQYNRAKSIALIDSVNDIGLTDIVQHSIVCGDPSPGLIEYLGRNPKSFVIASPENVVRFADQLTR